jgi:hypothetical protein
MLRPEYAIGSAIGRQAGLVKLRKIARIVGDSRGETEGSYLRLSSSSSFSAFEDEDENEDEIYAQTRSLCTN